MEVERILHDANLALQEMKVKVDSLDKSTLKLREIDDAYRLLKELDRKILEIREIVYSLARVHSLSEEDLGFINAIFASLVSYEIELSQSLTNVRRTRARVNTPFSRDVDVDHDLNMAKECSRDLEDNMIRFEEEVKRLILEASLNQIGHLSILPVRELYDELSSFNLDRVQEHLRNAVQLFGEKATEKYMLACASCRLAIESFIYDMGVLHNIRISEANRKNDKDFVTIFKKLRADSRLHEELEGPLIGFIQNIWSFDLRAGSHELRINPTEQEAYFAIVNTHLLLRYLLQLHKCKN